MYLFLWVCTPTTTDINTCINTLWSKAQTEIYWKMEFAQTPNSLGLKDMLLYVKFSVLGGNLRKCTKLFMFSCESITLSVCKFHSRLIVLWQSCLPEVMFRRNRAWDRATERYSTFTCLLTWSSKLKLWYGVRVKCKHWTS